MKALPLFVVSFAIVSFCASADLLLGSGQQIIFGDGTIMDSANGAGVPDGHGGVDNSVQGGYAFIGGGLQNATTGFRSTIGGGGLNKADGQEATVGGGESNHAEANYSTVGGGCENVTSGGYAVVAGGGDNVAAGQDSAILGGYVNVANGAGAAIGGGRLNKADGISATVPGGTENEAMGDYSVAMGRRAVAGPGADGSFVFADGHNFDYTIATSNFFAVRATNGAEFITQIDALGDPEAGPTLGPGDSSWSALSRRDAKENFADVDPTETLDKLAKLSVQRWNYHHQDDSIQHIGPYAEEFYAAFELGGEYDGRIATQDLDGVALVAIKALYERLQQTEARLAEVQSRLDALRDEDNAAH